MVPIRKSRNSMTGNCSGLPDRATSAPPRHRPAPPWAARPPPARGPAGAAPGPAAARRTPPDNRAGVACGAGVGGRPEPASGQPEFGTETGWGKIAAAPDRPPGNAPPPFFRASPPVSPGKGKAWSGGTAIRRRIPGAAARGARADPAAPPPLPRRSAPGRPVPGHRGPDRPGPDARTAPPGDRTTTAGTRRPRRSLHRRGRGRRRRTAPRTGRPLCRGARCRAPADRPYAHTRRPALFVAQIAKIPITAGNHDR